MPEETKPSGQLDDKGRCCGRKPIIYKVPPRRFCFRCDRAYKLDANEQIENWAYRKVDGEFVRREVAPVPQEPAPHGDGSMEDTSRAILDGQAVVGSNPTRHPNSTAPDWAINAEWVKRAMAAEERLKEAKLAYGKLFTENGENLGKIDVLTERLQEAQAQIERLTQL